MNKKFVALISSVCVFGLLLAACAQTITTNGKQELVIENANCTRAFSVSVGSETAQNADNSDLGFGEQLGFSIGTNVGNTYCNVVILVCDNKGNVLCQTQQDVVFPVDGSDVVLYITESGDGVVTLQTEAAK